jgi:hypothetical protein
MSPTRYALCAFGLAAAAAVVYVAVEAFPDTRPTVSAQWSLRSAGREPLIDMINTHAYQPSAWLVSPAQWKIWFCGGDQARTMGDSIFYTVADPRTNHAEKPVRVLAPGNNDVAEDGLHACAPSVIKRTRNAAEAGYLLYYECARRIYDRARNFNTDVGFAQICGATSEDGTAWLRLNKGAALIAATPRVLENWAQHGVYLAKSENGIHFGSGVRTNLPNDAHVKYFAGRFGGWDHVFIATTVIGKANGILVSEDGVNWLPADGSVVDAGLASNEHCAAPGPGELVGDDANNLVSLSVSFLSSEGYLGTADQGQKAGCYAASEDRVRGGSWKTYIMRGEIKPIVRGP